MSVIGSNFLRRALLIAALASVAPALAFAQVTAGAGTAAGDDTQPASARVGAVIFYDYTFQSSPKAIDAAGNTIKPNAFNVARTYLNITGNISHIVSYRITPDINSSRFSTTGTGVSSNFNGSLVFRLKYGYAQLATTDWTGKWNQSYVRLGIQQTPIIDYEEGAYRYRFQGTLFTERDGGMSSSDAGVSYHSNLPNNYGDFHVGIYNGEGYSGSEPNDQKAYAVRFSVRPMPAGSAFARGLRFTGYYLGDHYQKDFARNRAMFNVLLEQRRFNSGFDYLTRKDRAVGAASAIDSDGYSFFVTPFFKEKGNGWEALIRYDSFRPDSGNFSNRRQNRTIAGLAYWFPHPGGNATAAILLDYEGIRYRNYATPPVKQDKVIVHGLISF
jgi:hypothetical protein